MKTKIVWKLFRIRKDGSLGSLFINSKAKLETGVWLKSRGFRKKGFSFRPGWHTCQDRNAPHLSEEGRVWRQVMIRDYKELIRPQIQGSKWYLAKEMKILS